jgi:hypothetical protein
MATSPVLGNIIQARTNVIALRDQYQGGGAAVVATFADHPLSPPLLASCRTAANRRLVPEDDTMTAPFALTGQWCRQSFGAGIRRYRTDRSLHQRPNISFLDCSGNLSGWKHWRFDR